MKKSLVSAASALAFAAVAQATPVLQLDVNAFNTQAVNAANVNSPFGGITHTGAVKFSIGVGVLNGVFMQTVVSGPFANANFSGFTLTSFNGQVNLNGGVVTGGSMTLGLNNGDSYTCVIAPGSGAVSNYVGGGFKIEALTSAGFFNDSVFGNVNIAPWFGAQGVNGLSGSFLQFNFNPNANGAASSDMDLFVDVVPLPPAAWSSLATIGGVVLARRMRRR